MIFYLVFTPVKSRFMLTLYTLLCIMLITLYISSEFETTRSIEQRIEGIVSRNSSDMIKIPLTNHKLRIYIIKYQQIYFRHLPLSFKFISINVNKRQLKLDFYSPREKRTLMQNYS